MRLPFTLSFYIGRQFLHGIAIALGGLLLLTGMIDFMELVRRSSGKEGVPFGIVIELALLHLPQLVETILPFAVLIGGMLSLTRLTRTHELVVARAAGVSVWQFLMPAILLVFGIGVFAVTVFNPFAAALELRFEQVEGKYLRGRPSLLTVSSSGLWLRQVEERGSDVAEYIIHARRVSQQDMSLSDVILFSFGENNRFLGRMDAQTATLEHGYWHLSNAVLSSPGLPPQSIPEYRLKTHLNIEQIQDSFASPKTISFWELPGFIHTLEKAGFSALRHRLYWHSVLSGPMLLCAMIFIAAMFSLRLPRRGGIGLLITAGVTTGFALRFLTSLVTALGTAGDLPVVLAAWAPAGISLMIGTALLLHLEDG